VYGDARVSGNAWVYGNAKVCGDAEVCGDARVYGNTKIEKGKQIINVIGLNHSITVTSQYIQIGCKSHTFDEWMDRYIEEDGRDNSYSDADRVLIKALLPLLHQQVLSQYPAEVPAE
jgi:hypothetical protein